MQRVYRQGEELAREIAETQVPPGAVALWFLGQASMVIKGAVTVVYVDPFCSDHRARVYPPPLTAEQVPCPDWVLCTHNHLDHLDIATLQPIARRFPA